MTCEGRACGKTLQGGFKQEDGTYRCAACTITESYTAVRNKYLDSIVAKCNAMLVPGLRPTKRQVRDIRALVSVLKERK